MGTSTADRHPAGEARLAEPGKAGCPHAAAHGGQSDLADRSDFAEEIARAVSFGESEGDEAPAGVLLVSHGSRSQAWRGMLLDVHAEVAAELLATPGIAQVRTAFMEYTEPSIATQLRAFDESGVGSVIVVPLLLTISDHSFDDIPTICGLSSDPDCVARLEEEGIEIYRARAALRFAPLLDFSGLVQTNLARRVRALVGESEGAETEGEAGLEARETSYGLVLVGYGSAEFDDEWNRFFAEINAFAESELGVVASVHAWCGHLVSYSRQPSADAIEEMLRRADRAIVVPIFVAYDPMFQENIIGRAVDRCSAPERVLYGRDSILPEPEVGRWVIDITQRLIQGTVGEREATPG